MNQTHGDPNALSAGAGVVVGFLNYQKMHHFDAGDVVIERMLVHLGPPHSSFPSWGGFKALLDAVASFIVQDLSNFNVVGITVLPLDPTDSVLTWTGKATGAAGPSAYLVDAVYIPTEGEYSYIDPEAHAKEFAESLNSGVFKSSDPNSPPMAEFVSMQITEDIQIKLAWQSVGALTSVANGKVLNGGIGPALEAGYKASSWGKQLAIGLADFPSLLKPFVMGSLTTPGGGGGTGVKTPVFTMPGGTQVKVPSSNNLLVWGLFAVGGVLLAREAWKSWR